MLISVFKTMFGDLVPESKILPVIFFIALPLITSEFFRVKSNRKHYLWFILMWVLSPQIIRQGIIGYANLSFTFYLISASLIALLGFQHTEDRLQLQQILGLSGVLFALAAWNRPEGLALAAVMLLILAIWKKD